jgi:hypothetical protein
MHRRPLVANVDDLYAQTGNLVPDGLDVAALQAKESAHATLVKETRD